MDDEFCDLCGNDPQYGHKTTCAGLAKNQPTKDQIITTLTNKLQALRCIVGEYIEEVSQGCPADELPDLEKALADSEKEV